MTKTRNTKRLEPLAKLLWETGPLTAQEIARALRCSRKTAYAWVRALIARGDPITTVSSPNTRGSKTGPKPVMYGRR